MKARRLYGPTVMAGLAAGGLAHYATGRVWSSTRVLGNGLPDDTVTVTGADAVPVLSALALVVVAGSIAILAASVRIRKVVGLILIASGAIGAVMATRVVFTGGPDDGAFRTKIEESPAFSGDNFPHVFVETGWPFVAIAAFALAAVIGVIVLCLGSWWPTMGRKYDAPAARTTAGDDEGDASLWKAWTRAATPPSRLTVDQSLRRGLHGTRFITGRMECGPALLGRDHDRRNRADPHPALDDLLDRHRRGCHLGHRRACHVRCRYGHQGGSTR